MNHHTTNFDPDTTEWNNPLYWAEVLVIAERTNDVESANLARKRLSKINRRLKSKSPRPGAGARNSAACAARAKSPRSAGRVSITEKR